MQVRLFLSSHVLTMVTFCVYSSDIWETYIHSCTKAPPINVFAWLTEPCPSTLLWLSTILWCCCTTQFLEILFEPFNTIFCSMFAHDSFSKLNNNVLHLTSISALDVYKMRETMKEWRDLTIPIPKLDSTKFGQHQNGPMVILLEGLVDLASSHNCVIESTQHPIIIFLAF